MKLAAEEMLRQLSPSSPPYPSSSKTCTLYPSCPDPYEKTLTTTSCLGLSPMSRKDRLFDTIKYVNEMMTRKCNLLMCKYALGVIKT